MGLIVGVNKGKLENMESLRGKIEEIVYDNGKNPVFSLRFFLLLLSFLYGFIVTLRRFLFKSGIKKSYRPNIPVISIGNITAGGTGKTPFTIYVAELLKKKGLKPSVISRGYGGNFEKEGGIVHDGDAFCANVEDSGDEPYLIAEKLKNVPVYVGSSRIKSARLAEEKGADIIVLDDGFQHLKIERDVEIVLFDSSKPFGNGHLIPRGSLRDPLGCLKKADISILTRSENRDIRDLIKEKTDSHVFRTIHSAKITDSNGKGLNDESYKGKSAFAFSAIAHNEKFRKTAEDKGLIIKEFIEFNDHHKYSQKDIDEIIKKSEKFDNIVTTEKDFVKVSKMSEWDRLLIISIEIEFLDEGFDQLLMAKTGING